MSNDLIKNVIIDSSAGCGKTYCLEMRLIGMFLSSIEPRETIGMTFTNAAAAEIYRRLLEILCRAVQSEEKRLELVDGLRNNGWDGLDPDCEKLIILLKQLIRTVNDIPISTFDSFFVRILQLFPTELGLPGNQFSVIDQDVADEYCKQELKKLFKGGLATDFVEDCREALFGEEKKQVFDNVNELLYEIKKAHDCAGDLSLWSYWREKIVINSGEQLTQAIETCCSWMGEGAGFTTGSDGRASLLDGMVSAGNATEKTRFSKSEKKLFDLLIENYSAIKNGEPVEKFKKHKFPPEVRSAMVLLLEKAASIMILQAGRRTWGLGNFYRKYLAQYRQNVIERGKVTFADLPRLLSEHDSNDYLYDIDYRLNARLKHWLLDEFQDTSRIQLNVLQSMIDELDEERSLFVVGDAKQAIYSWRGGESGLMNEVKNHYSLEQQNLDLSYRFGHHICDGLNQVFGVENFDLSTFEALDLEAVAESWKKLYRSHGSAVNRNDEFDVVWCCPEEDDEKEKQENAEMFAQVISDRIKRIGRVWRTLDCVVLVRNAKTAYKILAAMENINPELAREMIWEGNAKIASDPLVAALTGWLIYLQHPANTAAAVLVQMHPATKILMSNQFNWAEENRKLGRKKLDEIILECLAKLPPEYLSNPNIEILLAAARRFEQQENASDMQAFHRFIANYKQPDSALAGKLRLMTIHHSKGLGFDVVFNVVAAPQKGNWHNLDTEGVLCAPEDDFVIYSPGRAGLLEPKIKRALKKRHYIKVLEEFCILYVAMTRAKSLVCNIIEFPGKSKMDKFQKSGYISPQSNASFYHRDWLINVLFGGRELSFSSINGLRVCELSIGKFIAPSIDKSQLNLEPMRLESGEKLQRFLRLMPSKSVSNHKLYYDLPENGKGAQLGLLIHDYFAKHEFLDDGTMPPDPVLRSHVTACLNSREVMEILGRRAGVKIWSEKPFELILPDEQLGRPVWRSGRFDRVIFSVDARGAYTEAVIVDFKSNYLAFDADLEQMAQPYLEQMHEYAEALRYLTQLAPERIHKYLIFTSRGRLYKVD